MNPSLEAWPPLARVRCPAHTARPGLGVLPNPPEACLGPMRLTPLHSLPTLPSTDSGGRPPRMKERRAKRVARFACSEPSMAPLYRKHCRIKQKGRGEGRVLFVFLQFVSYPCSCPPSPGNCRGWGGVGGGTDGAIHGAIEPPGTGLRRVLPTHTAPPNPQKRRAALALASAVDSARRRRTTARQRGASTSNPIGQLTPVPPMPQ